MKNLKLTQGTDLALSDLEVENLSLENGTKLNTENTNFPISVQHLSGSGGTLIANIDSGSIDLASTAGNINLDIRGWLDPDETYVNVQGNADGLTVMASQASDLNIVKDGNSFKTAPLDTVTPPPVTVTPLAQPILPVTPPTIVTEKGDSVQIEEKPIADTPLITQKGSAVTEAEKPVADVPLITEKGSSVAEAEKPTADVPLITEKGSSVTEVEKPTADVPETTQKGIGVTAEAKPIVEPVVQQTLASLTAEKPEVDTEALIAALRRAGMLLQQQQKAQRISNLVESNAAAQLNSIADVNMDIAQQVIEKFLTDGNQFRV